MRSSQKLGPVRLERVALGDPVAEWKRGALRRAAELAANAGGPSLRFCVTLGFFLFGASVGTARGFSGSVATTLALGSVFATHETARALVYRASGISCKVSLTAFAGILEPDRRVSKPASRVLVATVGAATNALMALALHLVARRLAAAPEMLLNTLAEAHAAWAAVSLVPLSPFDVGTAVMERAAPASRLTHAGASAMLVLATAAAVLSAPREPLVIGLCGFALFAAARACVEAYRDASDVRTGALVRAREADDSLLEGTYDVALAHARAGLRVALSAAVRERLNRVLAWSAVGLGDPFTAHVGIDGLPPRSRDLHLVGSYLATCNRVDEAIDLLESARRAGHRSRETTKLLADLLFRKGNLDAVHGLAEEDRALLSGDDQRAIAGALAAAG